MQVDWRNRWGMNWISSVRAQGGSQNCWAFAMTALYEAMVRIEHSLWCRRSEGEASRGPGKQAGDIGNFGEVSNFVALFGLADPDCFPWSESVALFTAKHPGSIPFVPLSSTPDREGRILKAPSAIWMTAPEQKKLWIETVGPMAAFILPPSDFGSLGADPYVPTTTVAGSIPHALLVIGFDDVAQAWIVKNSWGTAWGINGFGLISYKANLLEPAQFWGLRGTNPDPNTKRRLRNGAIVQSGNGENHNNFEVFIKSSARTPGGLELNIEHWSRDNTYPTLPWKHVGRVRSTDPDRGFNDKPLDPPAVVQSTFNRNFEIIYRSDAMALRHVYFDQEAGMWTDGGLFGPNDGRGIPGFIQSSRGAPGDFEVVILRWSGELEHWTKHNSVPWTPTRRPGQWYLKESFGKAMFIGGSGLVQTRHGVTSEIENGTGELHYVCVGPLGQMYHWSRPSPDTGPWSIKASFGTGISSAPVMIQGQFGMHTEAGIGNLELCVAAEGQVQHWWVAHSPDPQVRWIQSDTFGTDVRRVLGLQQGPFGYNLEMIVERKDGQIQHYFRDGLGGWKSGAIIT